jgi:hypothetical protein
MEPATTHVFSRDKVKDIWSYGELLQTLSITLQPTCEKTPADHLERNILDDTGS